MRTARRTSEPPRLELTPLLDVMFLLLTFFIFAFVLMVRLEVTDIRLPGVQSGSPVQSAPVLTIALSHTGALTIGDEPTDLASLPQALERKMAEARDSQLLIAVDERVPAGEVFKLMDTLRAAGRADLRFLRTPATTEPRRVPSPGA